jgi:hypothetical protein
LGALLPGAFPTIDVRVLPMVTTTHCKMALHMCKSSSNKFPDLDAEVKRPHILTQRCPTLPPDYSLLNCTLYNQHALYPLSRSSGLAQPNASTLIPDNLTEPPPRPLETSSGAGRIVPLILRNMSAPLSSVPKGGGFDPFLHGAKAFVSTCKCRGTCHSGR